ncbi:hypothetical protein CRG98_026027 [Punica granatum]|uniref:Reverse transcriptase/retrotransposon-derived protein RNase H-like domain-containing protein n=1 Tax=Punica granatum TaxID=22663 RepID=A0A2I0JBF1_PUNGR|nr:hypothetical protein CRG98_026027 [Punica granatum]
MESVLRDLDDWSDDDEPEEEFVEKIHIALEDQEKTTFTCPYGTFAFRRVPFGLCNAPATFLSCLQAFNLLKEKLTSAPVIVAPDWELPFELMCDASDYVVGAVLGQMRGKNQLLYKLMTPEL